MGNIDNIIRPPLYSKYVAADSKRIEFDYKNEVLVVNKVPVDYVFIGDSITERWELNAYFRGCKAAINRGIGSDTTEYILKRFEADALQLKPEYVILMAGINDSCVMQYDAIYGKPGCPVEYAVNIITGNIQKIIQLCREKNQKLVLSSILPVSTPYDILENARNEMVCSANASLMEIALEENIAYVDYYKYFIDKDGKKMKYNLSYDGVHPNVNGYNIMYDILRTVL
jgi:Lysophospholipase L1 and related esterases